jgi:hypothetical protein
MWWEGEFLYIYSTSVAVANLFPTCSTLTLTFCLTCPFLTNNTNPCTLAIPSPCLLISIISTSYSLPTSTGFGAGEPLLKPLLPAPP